MLAPVIAGACLGALIPPFLVMIFLCEEKKEASKAHKRNESSGGKRWLTYEPRKRAIDADGRVKLYDGFSDFVPLLATYNKVAEVLITLASASLIFIPSLRLSSNLPWLGMPLVLLGFTVVYALAFMGFLTYFYEQSRYDPTNVTPFRQALNYGLGFGALFNFALAYFLVAIIIGLAVSEGRLMSSH